MVTDLCSMTWGLPQGPPSGIFWQWREAGVIAQAHDRTPAQVLIAWLIQRGISAVPKSVKPARLRENLAAAELVLTPAELERIATLDQHTRLVHCAFWVIEGSPWTF
jgi:alcohol dehydrogenase (NADP+)